MKKKIFNRENHIISSLIEKEILSIQNHYIDNKAIVIESLKIIQKYYGWVSNSSLLFLSKILKIPVSDLESIATFYSQIFRNPVGRYVIKFCDSVVCYVSGYKKIQHVLEKKLRIKCGETTKNNNFTLLPICCLGACDKGPVIMINNKTYFFVTEKSIIKLLGSLENEK
ncbi:NADH-quinone oxidoreductase subunit NuoE [Buchnera aphidicola]|uniref:NADH-quinone oxidoreductase subunit NuoE n=1 Tax=Buchnera aphidicola TaxID=9 RepID=UPI0034645E99